MSLDMRLEPGILADAIRFGRAAAPNPHNAHAAEKMIEAALDGTLVADTDSAPTRLLVELLGPYASLVSDEARERLTKTALIVAPSNLFIAYAHRTSDLGVIVVFEGLLDVITLVTEMSHAVKHLPAVFKEIFPNPHYPSLSITHWTAQLFSRMIWGCCVEDQPQPDFRSLLPPTAPDDVRIGLIGGIWWTLLQRRNF